MWIPKFIKKAVIRSAAKDLEGTKLSLLEELNQELKNTNSDYKNALKEAEQMSKILATHHRIRTLKSKTQELEQKFSGEEDDEDDDEDDEQPEGFEGMIQGILERTLAKGLQGAQGPQNLPSDSPPSQPINSLRERAKGRLDSLSDRELQILDEKGLL